MEVNTNQDQPSVTMDEISDEICTVLKQTKSGVETTGEDLLLSDIKEIPTLVEPFLQQTGLTCLAGSSDTGKVQYCAN